LFFWMVTPCKRVGRYQRFRETTVCIFRVSIVSPEDGDSMFLRNVGIYLRVYTAPQPTVTTSSFVDIVHICCERL
jgi:hypothetical protein